MSLFNLQTGKTQSNEVVSQLMTITPLQAAFILEHKNKRNRKISDSTVEGYAGDMRNGKWTIGSESIAFYKDGYLQNGQHRLSAIVKSGVTIQSLVTFGLENDSINGTDQHRPRMAHDILTMKGELGSISAMDVAVIRLCCNQHKVSVSTVETVYKTLDDTLYFVNSLFPKQDKTNSSVVRAAMVLAINSGVSGKKIETIANILNTGKYDNPNHEIVFKLRDLLLKNALRGGSHRNAILRQIMYVISVVNSNKQRIRIITPTEYIYPLIEV